MNTIKSTRSSLTTLKADAQLLFSNRTTRKEIQLHLLSLGANQKEANKIVNAIRKKALKTLSRTAFRSLKKGKTDDEVLELLNSHNQYTLDVIEDALKQGKQLLIRDTRRRVKKLVNYRLSNQAIKRVIPASIINREQLDLMIQNIRNDINPPMYKQLLGSIIGIVLFSCVAVFLAYYISKPDTNFMLFCAANRTFIAIVMGIFTLFITAFKSIHAIRR